MSTSPAASDSAASMLATAARSLIDRIHIWGGSTLLLEATRMLSLVGRASGAAPFVDRLASMAEGSVPASAFLSWARGLVATDPLAAVAALDLAAQRFNALGWRLYAARATADRATAEQRAGLPHDETRKRAASALTAAGAVLFAREFGATKAVADD